MSRKRDYLSIAALIFLVLTAVFFRLDFRISAAFYLVFSYLGYYIIKRRNKKLTAGKYIFVNIFMILAVIASSIFFVLEMLPEIFPTQNKLALLGMSLVPILVYKYIDIMSSKKRRY